MRSLRYLNVMLTVLAVLLTLQLWTTWTTSPSLSADAHAQGQGIPNAGAQRKEMIDHLARLNLQVTQLNEQLRSGQTRVIAESPAKDEK